MEDRYRLGATARIRWLQGMQKEGRCLACSKGLPWEIILLGSRHTSVDADEGGVCRLHFLFVGVVRVDDGTVAGTKVADDVVGFSPEVSLVLPGNYSY